MLNIDTDFNLKFKRKVYKKQRTQRTTKLTHICEDYLYYHNTQILNCTSFNTNKIYVDMLNANT